MRIPDPYYVEGGALGMACTIRRRRLSRKAALFFFPAFFVLFVPHSGGGALGEDASVRAERLDGLIESLNASSSSRARVLETIYSELRGPDSREMQETLREALFRRNSLILQGVVEAMAMLGDPQDVSNLEALLATTDKLEVKYLVIRVLPAFCLRTERARFTYIAYATGSERTPREGALDPLRRPPLTRRGRLDVSLERLQGRVIRCLAAQFDPVGAALSYIDDLLYGNAARQAVRHFVGGALGNDPGRWARIWAAQGREMDLRVPGEVEEIRLAALLSLSDMGAEALPEVVAAFRQLENAEGDILRQAIFDAMGVMCRSAFQRYPALATMEHAAEDAVEGANWLKRCYASAVDLVAFTAQAAGGGLADNLDTSVFSSATSALGAALSYPRDFPDPDGRLAEARAAGMARLEHFLLSPDITREKRGAVAVALGEIGALRAVSAIAGILDSPYCSPEFGADGTRLAEAAIDALRNAAMSGQEGRDAAREVLLELLRDERVFPPLRAGTPPVGLAHMVLWRLQRLARSNDISFEPEAWRERLGW